MTTYREHDTLRIYIHREYVKLKLAQDQGIIL
jgi:hypothetical protein